eukprot:6455650-Amphidinium_carterae.1
MQSKCMHKLQRRDHSAIDRGPCCSTVGHLANGAETLPSLKAWAKRVEWHSTFPPHFGLYETSSSTCIIFLTTTTVVCKLCHSNTVL